MRTRLTSALIVATTTALAGCHEPIRTSALETTAGILVLAQKSMQQESDWEMASRAIPAALKTVEGFWVVDPKTASKQLVPVLTEGYCQYGTAFVEDDWEIAKFAGKRDETGYHNTRASKMFTRCLNYALYWLDGYSDKGPYHTGLFGTPEALEKLMKDTGAGRRDALMWAGLALGSVVNHNLSKPEMAGYLTNIKIIVGRVVELDAAHPPDNTAKGRVYAALPHIALGMVNSAVGAALGGDPKKATDEFQMALTLTADKMLLARSLMGYRVGVMTNDRKLFHDQLSKVLETDPAVWPEQRLANEVAHRRARRYLSHEKELF